MTHCPSHFTRSTQNVYILCELPFCKNMMSGLVGIYYCVNDILDHIFSEYSMELCDIIINLLHNKK